MKTKKFYPVDLLMKISKTDEEVAALVGASSMAVRYWRLGRTVPIYVFRKPLADLAQVNMEDVRWELHGE